MGSWWRRVGDWLSRRTVATLVAVLAVTGLFAVGLGALDFATGQDSYIDPESQVAKDNGAYQELFGGENMVVLFTVPEGKTVKNRVHLDLRGLAPEGRASSGCRHHHHAARRRR